MRKILYLLTLSLFISCSSKQNKDIKVFAWLGGPGESTDIELSEYFNDLHSKGIDGLMYNGGHNPATYERVAGLAKEAGMEIHAWIPTMIAGGAKLDSSLYAVNGLGESALDKPAYVPYYKFLCPNRTGTIEFLKDLYSKVADVEDLDGIHLDYIRFPDVILARGLWEKYGLVMDREYPQFDYCYCDSCVADFKKEYGIDILDVEDPAEVEEWKQFRYDLITELVGELAEVVHAKNKVLTAAVFPGPHSVAKRIVRQEWNLWEIDAFYPMNYNDFYLEDTDWIGEVCKEADDATDKPFYSGLFICPDPENKHLKKDPENHGLTPSELGDAIRKSIANGADGICLFTPGRMTDEGWSVLAKTLKELE